MGHVHGDEVTEALHFVDDRVHVGHVAAIFNVGNSVLANHTVYFFMHLCCQKVVLNSVASIAPSLMHLDQLLGD